MSTSILLTVATFLVFKPPPTPGRTTMAAVMVDKSSMTWLVTGTYPYRGHNISAKGLAAISRIGTYLEDEMLGLILTLMPSMCWPLCC